MPTQKSLDNLRPRKARYGEAKVRHEITVTPTAWKGLQAMATAGGCSVSEVIERLGRGVVPLKEAGQQIQGDVLEVVRWGNVHCTAQDALGNVYRCKREQEAP